MNGMERERRKGVGGPIINELRDKMATGRRRAAHIEAQLKRGDGPGGLSQGARYYAKEELSFIKAALVALEYHDNSLHPETSIPMALRDIIDELDRLDLPNQTVQHDWLGKLVTKARRLLSDLTRSVEW